MENYQGNQKFLLLSKRSFSWVIKINNFEEIESQKDPAHHIKLH